MLQSDHNDTADECDDCRKKTKRKQRVHDSANIPYPKFLEQLRTNTLAASKTEQ
jgi:hypothetical protein